MPNEQSSSQQKHRAWDGAKDYNGWEWDNDGIDHEAKFGVNSWNRCSKEVNRKAKSLDFTKQWREKHIVTIVQCCFGKFQKYGIKTCLMPKRYYAQRRICEAVRIIQWKILSIIERVENAREIVEKHDKRYQYWNIKEWASSDKRSPCAI